MRTSAVCAACQAIACKRNDAHGQVADRRSRWPGQALEHCRHGWPDGRGFEVTAYGDQGQQAGPGQDGDVLSIQLLPFNRIA
jgi:hypothetical protein